MNSVTTRRALVLDWPESPGKQVFLRGIADESPAAAGCYWIRMCWSGHRPHGAAVAAPISSGCRHAVRTALAETSAEIGVDIDAIAIFS